MKWLTSRLCSIISGIKRREHIVGTNYFSVDRRGFYKVGTALGLYEQNPRSQPPLLGVPDLGVTEEILSAHMKQLFPDGLSLHGWDYMTRYDPLPRLADGRAVVDYERSLELLLEYVRRAEFRDMPSRLQCYYAFDSLDDAKAFREKQPGNKPIYRLEADKVLRLDMEWLRHGNQNPIASYSALKYWSGDGAPTPRWEHMMVPPVHVVEQV